MKNIRVLAILFCTVITFENNRADASMIQSSKIQMGDQFACALRTDGKVSCWGKAASIVTVTPSLQNATDLSAFWHHACAIASGKVTCWGDNSHGQLNVPADLNNAVSVSVGSLYSCAATATDVSCWGSSGNTHPFSGLNGIQKVVVESSASSGAGSICVIASAGGVKCWSPAGEADITPPVDLGAVSDLKLGYHFACGFTQNAWKCWGDSNYSKAVTNFSDEYQLSTFDYKNVASLQTCELEDGALWCESNASLYAYIGVKSVAVGPTDYSGFQGDGCAITAEGVRCWGPAYAGSVGFPSELQSVNSLLNPENLDAFLGCYSYTDGTKTKVATLEKTVSSTLFDSTGKPIQIIQLSGVPVIAWARLDDVIKTVSTDELFVTSKTPVFDGTGKLVAPTVSYDSIGSLRVFKRWDGTYSVISPYGNMWNLSKIACN